MDPQTAKEGWIGGDCDMVDVRSYAEGDEIGSIRGCKQIPLIETHRIYCKVWSQSVRDWYGRAMALFTNWGNGAFYKCL